MELIMSTILRAIITVGCMYASYKMATEKNQNKIIWVIVAFLFGPVPVVIQYIVADFSKSKSVNLDKYIKPSL